MTKREYNTPVAEKIEFDYSKQVVASGQSGCTTFPVFTQKAHQLWEPQCRSAWKYIK